MNTSHVITAVVCVLIGVVAAPAIRQLPLLGKLPTVGG